MVWSRLEPSGLLEPHGRLESQMPPRCLPDASRCLPDASQMPHASQMPPDASRSSQMLSRCLPDASFLYFQKKTSVWGLTLDSYIYIYIYIGGWGRELGPPNREIVSFRLCVRAVLVKSVRSENVPVTPCIFYLGVAGGRILYLV